MAQVTIHGDRSEIPADRDNSTVGRSPMLEMRHTVDDQLQVATSRIFLPLRAVFHRNSDTLIAFSQTAKEVGTNNIQEKAIILTDKHLYVASFPSPAIFAPCSSGGCFSWKEFSRCCSVPGSHYVLFQFVSAVIAVQFGEGKDSDRCGANVYSLTGAPMEKLSEGERQAGRHFARDTRRLSLVSGTDRDGGKPTTASVHANESVDQSVNMSQSTTPGKRVLPSKPRAAESSTGTVSSDPAAPATIENMLRFILDSEGKEQGSGYESLFPAKGTQTDVAMIEVGIQSEIEVHSRANSPIVFENAEEAETESNYSDFDHTDVWKSLNPGSSFSAQPKRQKSFAATPQQQQSPSMLRQVTFRGNPEPQSELPAALQRSKSFNYPSSISNAPVEDGGSFATPTVDDSAQDQAQANSSSFASWLGVLAQYQQQFAQHGIDGVSKLLRLTDRDIESLLDTVGMHKHGHRVLLMSKVGVLRQAKNARK